VVCSAAAPRNVVTAAQNRSVVVVLTRRTGSMSTKGERPGVSFVVPAPTGVVARTARPRNTAMAPEESAVGVARKEPVRGVPILPPAVMNGNGSSHIVAVGTAPIQPWRLRHRTAAEFRGHST
jgi:hypothetical protein